MKTPKQKKVVLQFSQIMNLSILITVLAEVALPAAPASPFTPFAFTYCLTFHHTVINQNTISQSIFNL